MIDFALLNFIIHNFLRANVASTATFSCWNMETHHFLAKIAMKNSLYMQFINVDTTNFIDDIEYKFLKNTRPALGVFLDMNCDKSEEILNKISEQRLFRQQFHWLLYDSTGNLTNFQRLFEDASLSVDADLTYAILNEKQKVGNSTYIQYDVYNNGRFLGGKLNITSDREILCDARSCQLTRYLSELHLRSKYGNRERLNDITMRASTVVTKRPLDHPEPLMHAFLQSENNTRIDGIARFGFQILLLTKDLLGCKYTDRWSSNETHGGIIGAISTEEADLTSSPFAVTLARLRYISPLAETGGFRSICMFRTPRNTGIRGDVFLKPFSSTVWTLFTVFLIICAVFLWSTFIVEFRRMRNCGKFVPSFLTTCIISFGSACVQGSYIVPCSLGGRVAFFFLYLITFIMYNYYTSIVVSTLLASPVKSSIKTLGQLADSSLEVDLEPLPFTFVYLNTSRLPEVRRFVKRKIEQRQNRRIWISAEEGILKVRDKPGFVFVSEASSAYSLVEKYYTPHEICDLNEIMLRPDKSLYTHLHRNSTYKELVRLRTIRMLETGVYAKHSRHWVQTHLTCYANSFVIEVGMEYTAPLFFMLVSGYFLVVILLIAEILYKKYSNKKRRLQVLAARRRNN